VQQWVQRPCPRRPKSDTGHEIPKLACRIIIRVLNGVRRDRNGDHPFEFCRAHECAHVSAYDRTRYKLRNRVERFFNRLKHCRRVATRYDKLDANYEGFLCLAALFVSLA
jgi:transposase